MTTDPDNVKNQYHTEKPDAFLKLASLPSFNDDAGTVILLSGKTVIDRFDYSSKMHFSLIKDPEGVSLERVSFDRRANEAGNFRSAASTVGFATPGYKNSQSAPDIASSSSEVSLSSQTFSPDNDGFEDALLFNYHFNDNGLIANASVYNDKGVLVRKLLKNATLATEGVFSWDGLDENSNKANIGVYVVYLEVFDLKGKVKKYRKSCVLAAKF